MTFRDPLLLENNSIAVLACVNFGASCGLNAKRFNKMLTRLLKLSPDEARPRAYKMLQLIISHRGGDWSVVGGNNFRVFLTCLDKVGVKKFINESDIFCLAAFSGRDRVVAVMLEEEFHLGLDALKGILVKCKINKKASSSIDSFVRLEKFKMFRKKKFGKWNLA